MASLVEEIARAEGEEMENLFKALRRRHAELFPDWEMCTVFLPRGDGRNEQIDWMITMLQKMKNTPKFP